MNILVCNDDGIFSPGIRALVEVASEFGQVHVVAPDRPQSAVGHAITIHDPLRANPFKVNDTLEGFAVSGTPADCVKLAHDKLLEVKPDLVLSGINHGSNAGINLIYSGTVSAATEGTILGYKSLAVSCSSFDEKADLRGAQEAAKYVIDFMLQREIPKGITLNLNVPSGPFTEIRWCKMGDSRYVNEFDGRIDPHNQPYFWMQGTLEIMDRSEDVDVVLLEKGLATLTPIQYDLTDYVMLEDVAKNHSF